MTRIGPLADLWFHVQNSNHIEHKTTVKGNSEMLKVAIDDSAGIATLEPVGPLSKEDFTAAAATIDPVIENRGHLQGLLILTESFPGWDSFAAFCSHLKFVKGHHKKVGRVALVTISVIGDVGEHIASHFVSAEIKHFPYAELKQATLWVNGQA